jgi:hypothetical protein
MKIQDLKVQEIKNIAKKYYNGEMNQTDLIRAIQKAEGNKACFATFCVKTCSQMNCTWRTDCKKEYTGYVEKTYK